MISLLIICFKLTIVPDVYSWEEVRERMVTAMSDLDEVKISMNISVGSVDTNDKETAIVWKYQDQFRMRYGDYEMLLNEYYFLSVAHDMKQITWQKSTLPSSHSEPLQQTMNWLDNDPTPEDVTVELMNDEIIISMDGQESKIVLKVDSVSFLLNYFKLDSKSEIGSKGYEVYYTYEKIDKPEKVFSEKIFGDFDGDSVTLSRAYRNYEADKIVTIE